MARPEKVAVVDEIRTRLDESDAAVLTEYRGLTVQALAELRASLRPAGTEYKVFKNTLARRAVEGAGHTEIAELLEGPVAIAFVKGDAAAAAKALREFAKTNPELVLKGGLLGGRMITPADLDAIADLPSRDVLLAKIAGVFQAPLTKAAGLFAAMPRNMAYGIQALIDQRVAGGEVLDAPAGDASADEPASDTTVSDPEVPAEAHPEDLPATDANAAAEEWAEEKADADADAVAAEPTDTAPDTASESE